MNASIDWHRIPLPGLLLILITTEDKNPEYPVYMVKQRPETLDTPLFHAPLPNVFGSASICWGAVRVMADSALQSTSLAADWAPLLGSPFGSQVYFQTPAF
jgi:hypothetical protein